MSKNRKNKQVNPLRLFYFERQGANNTCRVHASNNALGKSILSKRKFFDYCDQFDVENHCKGSREFFFIESSNNNIVSFILNKLNVKSSYCSRDNLPHLNEDFSDSVLSVIVFHDGHIWATRKHDKTWYTLDSLSPKPEQIQFEKIFNRQGLGWIILWNDIKSKSNQQ